MQSLGIGTVVELARTLALGKSSKAAGAARLDTPIDQASHTAAVAVATDRLLLIVFERTNFAPRGPTFSPSLAQVTALPTFEEVLATLVHMAVYEAVVRSQESFYGRLA